MTRRSLAFCAALAVLTGCNRGPTAPYPEWAKPEPPYVADRVRSNAFDGYVAASAAAVQVAPEDADRVSFLAGMKTSALKKLTGVLDNVDRASRLPCTFEYRARDVFEPDPNAKGWRLIGRALTWKIESAIETKDLDKATHWILVATKFGFDLTLGDAETATLGFSVCNDARRAFAPTYQQLSASQLNALFSGLAGILAKYPGLSQTVKHEQQRMMSGVQFVQSARQSADYDELQRKLGRDAKQAIVYLRNLDESKRPAYFSSFASATKSLADHWESEIDKPRPDRQVWAEPEDGRTYRRFLKAFGGTIEPLSLIADACIARTRLLALSARALARSKATGSAPKDLNGLQKFLTVDPFSGNSLVYHASGADFRVYSVGRDNRDDGGESDEAKESPDLELEAPEL